MFLHSTRKFKMAAESGRKTPPVYSADAPRVRNFVEIALSHSICEINGFLCLTQKFKIGAKSGGKTIFAKSRL